MPFLRTYGTTLGPVGIPMADDQAFALDAIFKQLPAEDQRLRKAAIPAALLSLEPGERSDISWITTESIDRDKEIVLASGLRDAHFLHNPLVTLNHCYDLPPVGRCVGLIPATAPTNSPQTLPQPQRQPLRTVFPGRRFSNKVVCAWSIAPMVYQFHHPRRRIRPQNSRRFHGEWNCSRIMMGLGLRLESQSQARKCVWVRSSSSLDHRDGGGNSGE